MKLRILWMAGFAVIFAANTIYAQAIISFNQGFENDTNGWFDGGNGWVGSVTRVPTGTNGITSLGGNFHAIFEQGTPPDDSGPFTRFDRYRDQWTGPFTASANIYLDTSWAAGEGFDYSVAATGTDGAHQRDFIFHVTKDTSSGDLLVGGSNNTNFAPREDLDTLANHAVIGSSGWYTFEHQFYDNGGQLGVDLVLFDAVGTELLRETRTDASDLIPAEVGGNRYGWFTNIDIAGGIAVDNTQLVTTPEPTSLAMWIIGMLTVGWMMWRRRRLA